MFTLGDYLYNLRSFFTFKRTPPQFKKARVTNPVTTDYPPASRYAYHTWQDEQRARLALQTSWFYSAIQRISMAALSSCLEAKRWAGEEKQDIPNHPIELATRYPNPDMSQEYLWSHTIYSMYLKAGYWFMYPDSNGNLAEIWPMPFQRVRPVPDDSNNPTRLFKGFIYQYRNGKEQLLPPDNVVYLRFPNPFDQYDSLPPTYAVMKPIVTDNSQQDWNQGMFAENNGLPASIVSVPPELDDGQFEMVKRDLKEQVGKRMVTRGGLITVEFMQETHQEMEFLDGRKFNQAEIYEALGVPLDITNQDSWRWFINNTIWPLLQMISGQIDTQLTRPYFGTDVFTEFKDIRPQDRSLAVQESIQYAPYRSYNEERATRGEKPLPQVVIPDHIETYGGMSLYDDVPSKIVDVLLPKIIEGKPEPPPPQLQGGFDGMPSLPGAAGASHMAVQEEMQNNPDGQQAQQDTQTDSPQSTAKAAFENWSEIAVKKLARGKSPAHVYIDSAIADGESYTLATVLGLCRKASEVKAVFSHLDEYLNIKAQIGGSRDIPQSQLDQEQEFTDPMREWLAQQAQRVSQNTRNGEPPDQSFWDREQELLTAFLVLYLARWVEAGIAETVASASVIGIGLDATVNAAAADWAGKYALDMAKGITETTRELAKAKIKQWITARGSFAELEQSLAQVIAPQWRASLIAQTEITRAYAQANWQIAKELKIEKGLYWVTREGVCPICYPNNNKPVSKVGLPPSHPRCRCGTVMVL